MTQLCEKFEKAVSDYRAGKFGDGTLTLAEILRRAGEPDLFSRMDQAELKYLRETGQIPAMVYSYALKALKDRQSKMAAASEPGRETVATA